MSGPFLDSNILVYAFGTDARAARALKLLRVGGTIGVQTLNEFANVSHRKLRRDWSEIKQHLTKLRGLFPSPVPVDLAVHERGTSIAERYRLQVWDAMMIAAAMNAGCDMFWSEDLQDGLVVDGRLQVLNPFTRLH